MGPASVPPSASRRRRRASARRRPRRTHRTPPPWPGSATRPPPTPTPARVAGPRTPALAAPASSVRGRALEGLAAKADQPAARDAVLEVLERETNPGLL